MNRASEPSAGGLESEVLFQSALEMWICILEFGERGEEESDGSGVEWRSWRGRRERYCME